jgi:hypothetical protein
MNLKVDGDDARQERTILIGQRMRRGGRAKKGVREVVKFEMSGKSVKVAKVSTFMRSLTHQYCRFFDRNRGG